MRSISSFLICLDKTSQGTSSLAAEIFIFTEKDWNPWTEEIVQGMPEEQLKQIAYFASKTIAERTVWDFVKTHAV